MNFCGQVLRRDERARVIDQEHVPRVVDDQVSEIAVGVPDHIVEHLHPDHLQIPNRGLRLQLHFFPGVHGREPQNGCTDFVLPALLDRHRDHAEFEPLVEFVRRDLRLVAFPVTVRSPGRDHLPGGACSKAARLEVAATRVSDAKRDILQPVERGRREECFELCFASLPDPGGRRGSRRLCCSGGARAGTWAPGRGTTARVKISARRWLRIGNLSGGGDTLPRAAMERLTLGSYPASIASSSITATFAGGGAGPSGSTTFPANSASAR